MGKRDDGGPAFPSDMDARQFDRTGMTLRDWFAGQVMQGLCTDFSGAPDSETWSATGLAKSAYRMADAMLAERAKERAS